MKKEDAKSKAKTIYEEIQGGVNEVIKQIRELIKEGGARRLIIKNKEGKTVFETQLAMGVGGAALIGAMAPVISAIGMFAMFLNDMTILVERDAREDEDFAVDAEVIDITDDEEEEKKAAPNKKKGSSAGKNASSSKSSKDEESEDKGEKTVGKKKNK